MRTETKLLDLSEHLAALTKKNRSVNEEIASAREKFESRDDPSVQLYGLSQAGKSTFLSCLTLGEQFIPIGTGTATTAVVVELISTDSQAQSHAEVKWFSPAELQELVEQPLAYFLEDYKAYSKGQGGIKLPLGMRGGRSKEKPPQPIESVLDSLEYRKHLWKMLSAAKRARQADTTKKVGEDNDLAVTEIILRHYESYAREYRRGFQQIDDLAELAEWTRQPVHWGKWEEKPLDAYRFEEVKSFFTKTVRLYAAVQKTAEGVIILDTPGFGISNIHDRICRSAQIGAEAVFLIVGQQIGQDQMREMQQLSAGLKGNLFVIWNSKDGTKRNAQELLDTALIKLRNEAGIVVSKERTAVANLHLALRGMQWNALQAGGKLKEQTHASLTERFTKIYDFDPARHKLESGIRRELRDAIAKFTNAFDLDELGADPTNDALGLSGWNEVIQLLGRAKEIPQKQRELRFALSLVNASISYLEGFPTAKEIRQLNQAVESLKAIAHKLVHTIIKKNRRAMEEEWESESTRVFEEFLDYITDRQELKNLKSNLREKIKGAVHYSTVPAKLVAGVDDYVRARSAVWLQGLVGYQTKAGRDSILSPFNNAAFEIAQWVKKEWAEPDELNGTLELPTPTPPVLKIDDFRLEFIAWNKVMAGRTFTSSWVDKSVTFIVETVSTIVHETKKTLSSWWSKTKNWWYGAEKKVAPPKEKPSFDQNNAIREMEEKIDELFSKRGLLGLYALGEDQTAFVEAASEREGVSYQTWADVIDDYFKTENLTFWWERCSKLYTSWDNASGQIKKSLDDALDSWANLIEPILKERMKNLSSKSPEPAPLETLLEIERLFKSIDFEDFEDATLAGARVQLGRAVHARKVDS